MSQLPPLPPPRPVMPMNGPTTPLPYQSPNAPMVDPSTQKVFDRVTGPNLRLMDNLVQLACVIVGGGVGAMVGRAFGPSGMIGGLFIGLLGSLLLSGVVIGIIRWMGGRKRS